MDGQAGTKIILRNFPAGWCTDGRELLLVSLQAQLQVFGPLKGQPWIAPNLREAEVTFQSAKDAEEAIEVLHGVDFREPEEVATNPKSEYGGLVVALKQGKRGANAWQGDAPKKARTDFGLGSFSGGPSAGGPAVGAGVAGGFGAFAELAGVWYIGYQGSPADLSYTIEETGEVRVGKKRWLKLVPAGSFEDTKQDPNYAGTYFLNSAHREDTWEYLWLQDGVLHVHHFSTEDTGVSPHGSTYFWGEGRGTRDQGQGQPEMLQQPLVQPLYQAPQASWGKKKGRNKQAQSWMGLAAFEGTWTVMYEGEMEGSQSYTIAANGEVQVGKKRHLRLVPAGSPGDTRQDPNYAFEGVFLLDQCHREDTWEYVWMEFGRLCMHHFSEFDKRISPFGSPHFWGCGMATPSWQAMQEPTVPSAWAAWSKGASMGAAAVSRGPSYWRPMVGSAQKSAAAKAWEAEKTNWGTSAATPIVTPAHLVGAFEGTWAINYEPGGSSAAATASADAGGGADITYIISDSGEVRVGKKRKVYLVPAGSQHDVKQDGNYAGTYFLNDPHREDTWEYLWIEDERLVLHHFTGSDIGSSPSGSPNFYGTGTGVRKST